MQRMVQRVKMWRLIALDIEGTRFATIYFDTSSLNSIGEISFARRNCRIVRRYLNGCTAKEISADENLSPNRILVLIHRFCVRSIPSLYPSHAWNPGTIRRFVNDHKGWLWRVLRYLERVYEVDSTRLPTCNKDNGMQLELISESQKLQRQITELQAENVALRAMLSKVNE